MELSRKVPSVPWRQRLIRLDKKWLAVASVVVLRTITGWSMGAPVIVSDSPMYVRLPGRGSFDQVSMLGNLPRPWVVTLPFAITGTTNWLVLFNVCFGTLAWVSLIFSVSKIKYSKDHLHSTTIILIALLSCSEAVMAWDRFALSDSIALSGCVFVVAAFINLITFRKFRLSDFGLFAIGTVSGGLIRPGIGFLSLLFLVVLTRLDFINFRKIARTAGISFLVVLPLLYMGVSNQKMDLAWGKLFKGNSELHGRTLQQVSIINSTPVGAEFTRSIVREITGPESCTYKYLAQPIVGGDAMAWWLHMYEQCPDSVIVSQKFNSKFALSLLKHPKTTWKFMRVPIAESNKTAQLDNQVVSFIPPVLQDTIFGMSGRGFISPISYWLAFMTLVFLVLRRQKRLQLQTILLFTGSVSLFIGLLFTVAFSPLETNRVAQPFFVLSTVLAVMSIIKVLDDLFRIE